MSLERTAASSGVSLSGAGGRERFSLKVGSFSWSAGSGPIVGHLVALEKVKRYSVTSSFQNFLLNLPFSNAEVIHVGSHRDLNVSSSPDFAPYANIPIVLQKGLF